MSFELKLEKGGSLFHMRTPSLPKMEEVQSLIHLAFNAAGLDQTESHRISSPEIAAQQSLGQYKQDKIELGAYKEPLTGVRIRMLQMPETNGQVISAIRKLKPVIPITVAGWMHILKGNAESPLFRKESGEFIMGVLKAHNIYATIDS